MGVCSEARGGGEAARSAPARGDGAPGEESDRPHGDQPDADRLRATAGSEEANYSSTSASQSGKNNVRGTATLPDHILDFQGRSLVSVRCESMPRPEPRSENLVSFGCVRMGVSLSIVVKSGVMPGLREIRSAADNLTRANAS